METRKEKERYDVAVPQFKSETCESCFKCKERFNIGRTIKDTGWKVAYYICMDCMKELRPVSDITKELPGYVPEEDRFSKAVYYKMYDKINFG